MEFIENSNIELEDAESRSIYKEGDKVKHPVFGIGIIEKVDTFKNAYIIKFENYNVAKPINFDYKNLILLASDIDNNNT